MVDILTVYLIWSLLGLTVGLILHIGAPVKASLMTLMLAVVCGVFSTLLYSGYLFHYFMNDFNYTMWKSKRYYEKETKELGKKTKTKTANMAGVSSLGAMVIGYTSREWLKTQKRLTKSKLFDIFPL
jgi:hypothetical protein